jgi:hypothetical protein
MLCSSSMARALAAGFQVQIALASAPITLFRRLTALA